MADPIITLKKLLAVAPQINPHDPKLRDAGALDVQFHPDENKVVIRSPADDDACLLAATQYLENMGVHPRVAVWRKPEDKMAAFPNSDGRIDIDFEIDFNRRHISGSVNEGRGLKYALDHFDKMLENKAFPNQYNALKSYYSLLRRLNELAPIRSCDYIPNCAEYRIRQDGVPVIQVSFMNPRTEVQRIVHGGFNDGEIKEVTDDPIGIELEQQQGKPTRTWQIHIGEYKDQNMAQQLVAALNERIMHGEHATLKPDLGFIQNPTPPLSEFEIPVEALMENSHAVAAVFDHFLHMKRSALGTSAQHAQ